MEAREQINQSSDPGGWSAGPLRVEMRKLEHRFCSSDQVSFPEAAEVEGPKPREGLEFLKSSHKTAQKSQNIGLLIFVAPRDQVQGLSHRVCMGSWAALQQ